MRVKRNNSNMKPLFKHSVLWGLAALFVACSSAPSSQTVEEAPLDSAAVVAMIEQIGHEHNRADDRLLKQMVASGLGYTPHRQGFWYRYLPSDSLPFSPANEEGGGYTAWFYDEHNRYLGRWGGPVVQGAGSEQLLRWTLKMLSPGQVLEVWTPYYISCVHADTCAVRMILTINE